MEFKYQLINVNNNKVILDTVSRTKIEINFPCLIENTDLRKLFFGANGERYEEVDYDTLKRLGFYILERSTSQRTRMKRRNALVHHDLERIDKKDYRGIICKAKPDKVKIVYSKVEKKVQIRGPSCGVYGYSKWRWLDA